MTMTEPKVNNWNLPNALTTLRIVMVPFFGWALLVDGGDSVLWRCVAFTLFVIAMITDKIDGDIARARNLVTNFGKIADPIADKAITGMAFVGLSIVGDIWWWVTIVVLLREWLVTLLRLSVLKHVVIAAAQSGKVKTTLQALALAGLCAAAAPGRWLAGHDRRGALLRLPGAARRRRGDDAVVGVRVLPRRPPAAIGTAHGLTGPWSVRCATVTRVADGATFGSRLRLARSASTARSRETPAS